MNTTADVDWHMEEPKKVPNHLEHTNIHHMISSSTSKYSNKNEIPFNSMKT